MAVSRTQLVRLGVWVGLASAAVISATLAARTETGTRRIAGLFGPAEATRGAKGAQPIQMTSRQASEQEAEQRRLGEAIRVLAADRDRLLTRLSTLERTLDDVTGSIPQTPPASSAPPRLMPPAAQTNGQPAPQATAPATTLVAPQTAGAPATPPQAAPNRVAAGHLATSTLPATSTAPTESVVTRTEFGIDIGGNQTVEGLRAHWTTLKAAQPAVFDGLRPVIAVREGQRPGTVELRLIAGPIANAGIAARLCATLGAAGQSCQATVFDGQRLALQ